MKFIATKRKYLYKFTKAIAVLKFRSPHSFIDLTGNVANMAIHHFLVFLGENTWFQFKLLLTDSINKYSVDVDVRYEINTGIVMKPLMSTDILFEIDLILIE